MMTIKNKAALFLAIAVLLFGGLVGHAKAEVMEDFPVIKVQALDKSTARTVTFQAKVGSTIEYGSLYIKTQACRKSPPLETPESAAFLQIWEVPIGKEKSEWIFSGWMFASSPALSAMDHPVYDVWVLDCLEGDEENKEAKDSETKKQIADPTALESIEEVPNDDTSENTDETIVTEEPETENLDQGVFEDNNAEDQEMRDLLDTVIDTPAE